MPSDASVADLLSGVGLPQYAERFEAHHITSQTLGSLTEADLEAMGISSVGHRKRVMGALRTQSFASGDNRRAPSRAPHPNRDASPSLYRRCVDILLIIFSAVVTGQFLEAGRMSWRDVIDLNTQLSTVSALVWFASITFTTGLSTVFAFPFGESGGPGMEGWIFRTSYFFFAVSCVFSSISTLLGVYNNMIMYQVSESHFAQFMLRSGNIALRISFLLFTGGVVALVLAFEFMIYGTMPQIERWAFLAFVNGLVLAYVVLMAHQVRTLSQIAQIAQDQGNTDLDGVQSARLGQVPSAAGSRYVYGKVHVQTGSNVNEDGQYGDGSTDNVIPSHLAVRSLIS